MIQKIIKPPLIDALVCSDPDHSLYSLNQNNDLLRIGTKLETNYRTLLQFDLSPLPFFATIISCTFHFFVAQNENSDCSSPLGAFQVLSEWNPETITWNEQPLIHISPVDSISVTNQTDTFLSFNITTLLQDWFSNRSVNLGLMLKFMDESHGNLLAISGKKYRDSRFWPYLELNILNPVRPTEQRALQASLEQSVTVVTHDTVQCTSPVPILIYNYSYLVVNSGGNSAMAYLQVSPDGATWETQSSTKIIIPGTVVSFVPNVIAKYARLCYQSLQLSDSTTLTIYIQGA